MAGWNALFHQADRVPARSREIRDSGIAAPIWSKASAIAAPAIRRATRSARNRPNAYLAGGFAEGWEAPPLTSLSHAPIPWSEDELFAYLRTGESRFHGVAAGPMAPVVKELAALPDPDIRAMAVYLASFNETAIDRPAQDALAAQTRSRDRHANVGRHPASAPGSITAPARSATRSAARRCSAAGRRWR